MLNKVPEVTAWFWVIKVLATTVGETFADYLDGTLGLGLGGTSVLMTAVLVVVLVAQLRADRYRAPLYWLTVVLVSVVGTLLTDCLTDAAGVPLVVSTTVFAVALAATFAIWFAKERTLSIHAVTSLPRELFYWLAVLLTFALGTAAGDLLSEQVGLGYWPTALLVAVVIAAVAATRYGLGANAVACFWVAYVLTRPLGASLGDGFSQAHTDGGLGLGTTWTSVVFLGVILACVTYLTVTKRDQTPAESLSEPKVRH
ncbi:Uncharacterized membrane-anchored protein [Quadrisphaera granulorum]|uniref:Putative membrane-anchored protein n=1 Tax=Quadrisphaera granulorum TaxID=317664 RepID=A0A316A4P5_9ACTN|nr:putative membrane-anchored protein [Quadrisphaera granulorum]SZE97569.1 Uncharacterized membrane-anchored protein [Quadrisphaera granulorum]